MASSNLIDPAVLGEVLTMQDDAAYLDAVLHADMLTEIAALSADLARDLFGDEQAPERQAVCAAHIKAAYLAGRHRAKMELNE
jgi:hypothetical protein